MKQQIMVLLSFLIAGCVSIPELPEKGPQFEPSDSNNERRAVIYLYRNSRYLAGDVNSVSINDKEVSRLPYRGYSRLLLEPDCYTFNQKWPKYLKNVLETEENELCVKAGETYYIKIDPVVSDWSSYTFGTIFYYKSSFKSMEINKALHELNDTYNYDLKNLKFREE
jgi:hypothetical protein